MKRVTTLLVSTAVFLLSAIAFPAVAQATDPGPYQSACGICWETASSPR